MNNEPVLNPPGMQGFLARLSRVEGHITIQQGVLYFQDGTHVDLKTFRDAGLNTCWHCGALMNAAQRYVCGCPKCIQANEEKPL